MARKSYKQKYNSEDGVWRTIGGRRVFIRHGQSLSDAMKESGKFKNLKREDVVKGRAELQREESTERAEWFKRREKASTKKREQKDYHDRWNETTKETKEAKELLDIYGNPTEFKGDFADLEGKHILGKAYETTLNNGDKIKTGDSINYASKMSFQDKDGKVKPLTKLYEGVKVDGSGNVYSDGVQLEKDRILGKYSDSKEYTGDISDLEGKHIAKAPRNLAKESADQYMKDHYEERKQQFENWQKESQKIGGKDDTFERATNKVDTTKLKGEYFNLPERTLEEQASDERYANARAMYKLTGDEKYKKIYQEEIEKSTERVRQEAKNTGLKYKEDKFYTRKDGTKEYDPYKGTKFEKKYDSMDDVIKDPNSALNKYISEKEAKDELKEISGGVVSTLQRTTPKSKADRLKPGTEIYYTGDQANVPGYFTIEKFEPEKEQFLASVTLKEKGGEGRTFKIGSQSIANEYGKDPGARFSFKEDYDNYRNKVFEGYAKQIEERKTKEKVELSKQIAREIYGKGISDEVAERYGKELIPLQEGTVTSELRDWEWDKDKMEWTKEALQNRLTYLTKGYDEAQKEGKKFEEEFEKRSLRTKYKGTFEYLEETTNMSGAEILELLKKIEEDKK